MSAPSSRRRRIGAHAALELRLLLRSGESLLVTFGVPLGLLVLFGTTELLPVETEDPLTFLVPGVLGIAILSTGFVAQSIQTGFERKYGVLKRLGASPLTRPQFVAGKSAATLVVVVVQVVVLLGVAVALGWSPSSPSVVATAGAVLLGTATFTALGLALAGAVRAELVLALSNAVYLVMIAASDLVLDLPASADVIVRWTPSGALGSLLRYGLGGEPATGPVLAGVVVAAWGLLAVVVAARTFRWEA